VWISGASRSCFLPHRVILLLHYRVILLYDYPQTSTYEHSQQAMHIENTINGGEKLLILDDSAIKFLLPQIMACIPRQ
jgi:hypothetical protein